MHSNTSIDMLDVKHCIEVARRGLHLDVLKDHPSAWVRAEVAKHGYFLDHVKFRGYGIEHLEDVTYRYPVLKPRIMRTTSPRERAELLYALGHSDNTLTGVEELHFDISTHYTPTPRITISIYIPDTEVSRIDNHVATTAKGLCNALNSDYAKKHLRVPTRDSIVDEREIRRLVEHNLKEIEGPNIGLKHDPHWIVRAAIAEQGLCLDELVHDHDPCVRKAALGHCAS